MVKRAQDFILKLSGIYGAKTDSSKHRVYDRSSILLSERVWHLSICVVISSQRPLVRINQQARHHTVIDAKHTSTSLCPSLNPHFPALRFSIKVAMKKQDSSTRVKAAVIFSIAFSICVFDAFHLNGPLGTYLPSFFSQCAPSDFGNFPLAFKESSGYFRDIRELDWKMLKERVNITPPCKLDCGPEEPHKWYQNNWEPAFTCLHERRIGRWGDGGKWVCDPHRITLKKAADPCLVYSVGSNNDFSFEEAVPNDISMDCEIHT